MSKVLNEEFCTASSETPEQVSKKSTNEFRGIENIDGTQENVTFYLFGDEQFYDILDEALVYYGGYNIVKVIVPGVLVVGVFQGIKMKKESVKTNPNTTVYL